MPVCGVKRSERPSESRPSNTAIHHWILLDIRRVIESDEVMPDHLRINRKRHDCQSSGNRDFGAAEFPSRNRQRSFLLRCLPGHCDL